MKIKDIMSSSIVRVDMDDTLGMVRELFKGKHFHHLLVTDGQRLVGVISDRDVLKWINPRIDTVRESIQDKNMLRKRVHQIMNRNPVTVSVNSSIKDGGMKLLENNISCLPVIDELNHIKGIVTWKDILNYYFEGSRNQSVA